MIDTPENTGTDGIPTPAGDEVRDEVRLDLDEKSLDTWADVRGDYALDPESEVARPGLTESEDDDGDDAAPTSEDDEEDAEAEDDHDEGQGTDEEE